LSDEYLSEMLDLSYVELTEVVQASEAQFAELLASWTLSNDNCRTVSRKTDALGEDFVSSPKNPAAPAPAVDPSAVVIIDDDSPKSAHSKPKPTVKPRARKSGSAGKAGKRKSQAVEDEGNSDGFDMLLQCQDEVEDEREQELRDLREELRRSRQYRPSLPPHPAYHQHQQAPAAPASTRTRTRIKWKCSPISRARNTTRSLRPLVRRPVRPAVCHRRITISRANDRATILQGTDVPLLTNESTGMCSLTLNVEVSFELTSCCNALEHRW
jgi:hypothetical protein